MARAQRSAGPGSRHSCATFSRPDSFFGVGAGPRETTSTRSAGGRRNPAAGFALGVLAAYKRFLSPFLPRACRFSPTCSEYARLAILKYGFWKGSWRALGRVLRCHPFHPGGVDLP